MAAGQQKKRLVSSSLHEHYKEKKKKKLDSCDYVLNFSPRVYLKWDDHQKTVVPKREQIGISWLDMATFLESVPQSRKGLADVICVPKEIFSLNNLMDVLSYEVWATCLSETERKLLTQFLPGGSVTEEVVHSLLAGDNHHFGNPFLTWSSSLCSCSLHPDDVLWKDQQIRTNRKQYYSELNEYHTDMLEGLKKWKEMWLSCKDPEKLWSKGATKNKQGTISISTERAKVSPVPKKAISNRIYIRNGDIAKYMSYIKISKEQHEVIKNIKHSGDGIQTKSLSRVLGDIKRFRVLPFETLVEEEKTRLHEHWLQVVNKDLPVSFEAKRKEKMQKDKLKRCLQQEFAEKRALRLDKAQTDNLVPQEQIEDGESVQQIVNTVCQEDVASVPAGSSHCHYITHIPALSHHQEPCPTTSDQLVVCHGTLNSFDNSPVNSLLNGKNALVEDVREPKSSSLPPKDIWQAVTYQGCKISNDLCQRQLQPIDERRNPIIDLERNVMEQEVGESVEASLFTAFSTQSQDNLLARFPKGPEILSSYGTHEHMNHMKEPELQFLMANGHLSEPQYPHQLQEQQSLIDQAREKELYMHGIMNKNVFSSGRYPNQEIYSSANGGLMENNWFPGDLRTHNHWARLAPPSSTVPQCLGGNTDGSLFSVLSGCRNLPSQSIYDATSSEQLMESRNFVPNEDSVYGFASNQFRNSSIHESTPAAPSALNIPWMNYPPHQNPSMQDSIGKPYPRSWNH